MKEAIIRYKDSRVLELLKKMAAYLDFSISEKPDETTNPTEVSKATDFVNKWAGFLKSPDTDSTKYNYLSEKYK